MKIGKASLAGVSIWLLAIQLAIVSSIAGKYLYQRATCPRVWVRSAAFDPEGVMRGRYLSLQIAVDGCQSTLPSAKMAAMPRDQNGVPTGRFYWVRGAQGVGFQARLSVRDGKLIGIRMPEAESGSAGQAVVAAAGANCADMWLETPVDFYISEHVVDPSWVKGGQQLWVEVTVPSKGPPRPVQLALKDNGVWKPLAFE